MNLDGKYFSHLRYTDDIVLFGETPVMVKLLLETLNEQSQNVRLLRNTGK